MLTSVSPSHVGVRIRRRGQFDPQGTVHPRTRIVLGNRRADYFRESERPGEEFVRSRATGLLTPVLGCNSAPRDTGIPAYEAWVSED